MGLLLVGSQLVLDLGPLVGDRWADVGPWVEISTRLGELTGGSLVHWGHLAVAGGLWTALPWVIGAWRIHRADVA